MLQNVLDILIQPKHICTYTTHTHTHTHTHTNTNDLASNLRKVIEAFKSEINKHLEEIQENTIKQLQLFKGKANKSLKYMYMIIQTGKINE
jgi:mevalonate kinase